MSTFAIQLCATGHENVLSAHQPSSITRPLQAHPVRPLVFTFLQRTSDRPLVLYCFVEALWKVWRKLNGKIKDPASDFVFLGRLFSNTMLRYVGFSWPGGELREFTLSMWWLHTYYSSTETPLDTGPRSNQSHLTCKGSPLCGPPQNIPIIDSKNTTLPSSGFSLRAVEYEYDDDVTYRYSDRNVSYHGI